MSTDDEKPPATSTSAGRSSPTAAPDPQDATAATPEQIHRAALERIAALSQQWRQLVDEITGRGQPE